MKQNIQYFEHVISSYIGELERVQAKAKRFQLTESHKDVPTLKVEQSGRELFLHSKYNPMQEAERIVRQVEDDIADKQYILFVGIGLGYHIEELLTRYPNKSCIIIEPHAEVFVRFLESRSLRSFPANQVRALYIQSEKMSLRQFLTNVSADIRGNATVVVLPAYERIFKTEIETFYAMYQEALKMTMSSVIASKAFGKRWVINSLRNVPKTLTTENIREKKEYFKGKPVIIAAAGPSLYDDLDKLKYIKEHGLAYIFAVGSANKAFIVHDIIPDAVITYDPQPHNVSVFRELIASGRTDVPMIYGTSVGFETTETYPGPLFHFINSADTVTNYYLGKERAFYDVQDSTTIALIAIQLCELLEVKTVILAGQNLAFKNERYYAQGIKHGDWEGEVREEREGKNVITTTDVYGNEVETNDSLNNMRRDIETYIENRPNLNVINTTKGGANIKGVPFSTIEDLLETKLKERVVVENWYESKEKKVSEVSISQLRKMRRAIDRMYSLLEDCFTYLEKVGSLKNNENEKQVNRLFNSFDKSFNRILRNDVYTCFIATILKHDFDQLKEAIEKSRHANTLKERIEIIVSSYTTYLKLVKEYFYEFVVHLEEVVHPKINQEDSGEQMYNHHDGVFHYEGDWEREFASFSDFSKGEQERKLSKAVSTKSTEQGAKIKFRFKGTQLKVLAQTSATFANNIKITIDGTEKTTRARDWQASSELVPKLREQIFKVKSLPNEMHDVCIELGENEPFHFQGITINDDGRVYHVDEVTSIEELEVGKRIRCHYKATVNKVGEFSRLGEATNAFIPVQSTPQPDGDFYFIMVDEDDGEKKLIADRNVQNYISFNTVMEKSSKRRFINLSNVTIRLPNTTNKKNRIDEWQKYIANNNFRSNDDLIWNHVRDFDANKGLYSLIDIKDNESAFSINCCKKDGKTDGYEFNGVSNYRIERIWGYRPMMLV